MPPVFRYAGFGNESSFGVAAAVDFHVDMASATLDAPSGTELYYGGGLGRGVRTRRPGYYVPGGNIVYAWDIRTIAAMLRWTLGGYAFLAVPAITLATSAAADDIIDTTTPHLFAVGDRVRFSGLTGGAGLSAGVDYFVIAANLAAQTFQVSATPGGAAVNFTTDITAGTVRLQPFNRHESFGTNESLLPSFTSRIGKDVFEHVFAGCVVDSLELDLASDFLLATMAVNAKIDSEAALTAESALLLPAEFPLAFHEVTLELPTASDISPAVKALKLSIKNGGKPDAGRGVGSRYPARLPSFGREVTLGCDLWYDSVAQLERFWGDTAGPAADGADNVAIKITADAGTDGKLVLSLPVTHFTKVGQTPSGRDEIVQSTEIRAMVSPILLADGVTTVRSELLATTLSAVGDLSA